MKAAISAGGSPGEERGGNGKSAPVAAIYCATFLKPEMLHVYRQIDSLRRYRAVVVARKTENEEKFPFSPIVPFPKPWDYELRRFVNRRVLGRPNLISKREAARLAGIMEGLAANVAHIYFGNVAATLLPFLRVCRLPVVVSFHGADVRLDEGGRVWREVMAETLERAALVLARSESLARAVEELGAARGKIRIQRTGIPLSYLHFIERQPPADGAWRLLQACRLVRKKGLRTTLEAFRVFRREFPRARLVIAGEGPLLEELQAAAAELGVADGVSFTGFLDQAALREQYAESHIFVHPSETAADGNVEGIPNSLLEAMATGLPVVSTRHGGIPEAVTHGESGFLAEERDAGGVAEGLLALARDAELYQSVSRRAAGAVAEKFDMRRQIPLLESHYDEARRLYEAGRSGYGG